VLTGVTNLDMYARSKVKATFVANSLKSLSDEL
jgi:hypothetical protein